MTRPRPPSASHEPSKPIAAVVAAIAAALTLVMLVARYASGPDADPPIAPAPAVAPVRTAPPPVAGSPDPTPAPGSAAANPRPVVPTTPRLLVAGPDLARTAVARGVDVSLATGRDAPVLRCVAARDQAGVVELALPAGTRLAERMTFVARVRVDGADGPATSLKWLALDAARRPIFQRRFALTASAGTDDHAEPLRGWRWGDAHHGSWDEVAAVALVLPAVPSGVTVEIEWLDVSAGDASDLGFQLAPLMQADGPTRFARRGRLLLGTDVPDAIDADALDRLAARLAPIEPWLVRLFGDAVRPTDPERPIPFLVFASPERRAVFFAQLGRAWNVQIAGSRAGGYTVQDIATSDWIAAKGMDRPVYLHEAVHAFAARLLRINPGVADHSWLQEGLANYLQLCLYPTSFGRDEYPRAFAALATGSGSAAPGSGSGSGPPRNRLFRPLATVLAQRADLPAYAQLASVTGYLVERHSDWLPALARGVADGKPLAAILRSVGTDVDALEREWIAWGRERYATPGTADAPHFPRPPEWP